MADIKENDMLGGIPVRLRGVDAKGNSILSTFQEATEAMPMATTNTKGIMYDFHARKVEGVIFAPSEKNRLVYKTTLNTWNDLYATFKICVLYATGVIECADCFFVCVNNAGQIYLKKMGVLTAIVKSFIMENIVYFYMEFNAEYGRVLIYPDFGLRIFELTEMTNIPGDATHVISMQ